MKRRLALVLAAALTLGSIPVTGAFAAENVQTAEPGIEIEAEAPVEILPGQEEAEEELVQEILPGEEIEVPAEEAEIPAEEEEDAAEEADPEEIEAESDLQAETGVAAMDQVEEKANGFDKNVSQKTIYRKDDGTLASGWVLDGDNWYYFDPETNEMVTKWIEINNKWYFLDEETGIMKTGWFDDEYGNRYWLTSSGAMYTGWGQIEGEWYYFSPLSGAMKTGWQKISDKWYFFDKESGIMKTGWYEEEGKKYFFSDAGVMWTGWGQIEGEWYYFKPSGAMAKGWADDGKNWYYLDQETGHYKTGWLEDEGKTYYFTNSGAMWKGWGQIEGKWYYFNKSGALQTEWTQIGDDWYYLGTDGAMQSGWVKLGSTWYYLNPSSGKMHKGPTFVGKTLWYLDKKNGWLIEGFKGWLKPEGTGEWYYVYTDGHCAVNTTINGYVINEKGFWPEDPLTMEAAKYTSATKYLIVADRREHWLAIFKATESFQRNGETRYRGWVKYKGNWRITTGGSKTPTPLGEHLIWFKDGDPYGWQSFTESKAAWCTYVNGNPRDFYIHSILYYKDNNYYSPSNTRVLDDELGANLSHSCIRLSLKNAEWVYDNIPKNTKLVVFESTTDYPDED